MSEYSEVRKELDNYIKNGTEINHEKAKDVVADFICKTKDKKLKQEIIDWSKSSSSPDGMGPSIIKNNKMVESWWFEKMYKDLK